MCSVGGDQPLPDPGGLRRQLVANNESIVGATDRNHSGSPNVGNHHDNRNNNRDSNGGAIHLLDLHHTDAGDGHNRHHNGSTTAHRGD